MIKETKLRKDFFNWQHFGIANYEMQGEGGLQNTGLGLWEEDPPIKLALRAESNIMGLFSRSILN